MDFRVHLLWKVLLSVDPDAKHLSTQSPFFNLVGGKSFVRALGGDFCLEHAPVVLTPTDLFHRALRVSQKEFGLEGQRFPYRFPVKDSSEHLAANFAVHRHDRVLCLTVRLSPFILRGNVDWPNVQDLRSHTVLWPLVKKVLAIVTTGSATANLSRTPQVLPAIHIQALKADLPNWASQIASLVTTHENVHVDVVNAVLKKNQPHLVDNTLLLVDKQGVAAYVPSTTSSKSATANLARFEHSAAMLELAAALRLQLRDGASVASDLEGAIRNPEKTVVASVSGRNIWSLFVEEFSLRTLLQRGIGSATTAEHELVQRYSVTPPATKAVSKLFRILLFTVTKVETLAVRTALMALTGREPAVRRIESFTYQFHGKIGDYEITHQISGMGSGGIGGSQESVRRR